MNEIITADPVQLPDTIADLATWDRFLSARLPTYRKLLHNVKSWEEATEEEHRILRRAQEESENLIDVRVRIGELYKAIPEESGKRTDVKPERNVAPRLSQKQEFKQQTGLSDDQAKRYAKMAAHPEAVEKAKADARERNDVVSQQDVLNRIIIPQKSKEAEQRKELKEARKRQDEFKESKTVSINDIKQNKEDTETLGRDMFNKLSKLVDLADKITFAPKSNAMVAMIRIIPTLEIANLANGIERTLSTLADILEEI